MKVSYPSVVVGRRPVLPEGMTPQERKAAGDFDAMVTLLMFLERHGSHSGWRYDPGSDCIACDCGALAFEVGDPVTGAPA
jgi:hypothetical protein